MVCCYSYTTSRVLTDNLWALEFLEEFKHQIVEPQTCHSLLKRKTENQSRILEESPQICEDVWMTLSC